MAAVAVLSGACGPKGIEVGAPPEPQGNGATAATALDRNLILNGDAEMLVQGNKETVDGWSKTADVVPMNYGGMPDEWQSSKPGCPDGRDRYFRLALAINEPSKSINQRPNLNGVEAEIDSGALECALGGWFGGWVGGDASARLEVDFLAEDGSVLGTLATEAPDPAKLPKPELGRAAMVKVIAAGPVPAKTRRLDIRLAAVRPTQKVDTNAVATADSLSVVLRKKGN
jgi:hypothetical protein